MHEEPDALPATRAEAVERALAAFDELVAVGEAIEEEWIYVTDLAAAGRAVIRGAGGQSAAAGQSPPDRAALPADRAAAVVAAAAEIGAIEDPHRAIDWLSTYPAIVALALGSGDA
jgi:hypothetical protein